MYIVIETSDNTDAQAYGPFSTEAEATEYKSRLVGNQQPATWEQDSDCDESHNEQFIVQMIRKPHVNGYENDTDHARLKVQIIRQAIEADPNNLDLYERWSDLELMLGDLLGANY